MDNKLRAYIYAFLSNFFKKEINLRLLEDLIKNGDILELIGEDASKWILEGEKERVLEELNIDFTTLFIMNSQPIESAIVDDKDEVLVGLQNPVMQFYFNCGYDLMLNQTEIQTPDHISLEFAFMQNLVTKEETSKQLEFLNTHLLPWAMPYLLGLAKMAETPFYKDLCEFAVEFMVSEVDFLEGQINENQ